MDEVLVTEAGDGSFRVEVRSRDAITHHEVTVPADLAKQTGCEDVAPEELVRQSFAFLLEREPSTSVLNHFSLDQITRYFPEYPADIRRRCSEEGGSTSSIE